MPLRSTYTAIGLRHLTLVVTATVLAATGTANASQATTTPEPSRPSSASIAADGEMFSYDAETGHARYRSCGTDTQRQDATATSEHGLVRGSLATSQATYDFTLPTHRAATGRVRVTREQTGQAHVLTGPVTTTPPPELPSHDVWDDLETDLREVLSRADSDNRISVSVQDLSGVFDGAHVTVGVDDPYRAASTIKVPILAELLRLVDCGELALDEMITVTDDDVVGGSGELKDEEMPLDLSVYDLAHLMITVSDNTATNVLIDRTGFDGVNALADMQNLDEMWLGRKMMHPGNPDTGEENFLTAEDAVHHLTALYAGPPLTDGSQEVFLDTLRAQEGERFFKQALPGVPVAHKSGGLTSGLSVTHDIGYILEPGREVALAVMTEGPRDTALPTAEELVQTVYQHITADAPDRTESMP
ncbi:MAG TPA: serine hydrolase [Jiangellaceae bacterium]|nr:serine hydrolase [Jiangellaceae bacterium]